MGDPNLSSFIWSVADLLRGDYKQSEYRKVILPFTVLRRLDCVLEPTKAAVLVELAKREKAGLNKTLEIFGTGSSSQLSSKTATQSSTGACGMPLRLYGLFLGGRLMAEQLRRNYGKS